MVELSQLQPGDLIKVTPVDWSADTNTRTWHGQPFLGVFVRTRSFANGSVINLLESDARIYSYDWRSRMFRFELISPIEDSKG